MEQYDASELELNKGKTSMSKSKPVKTREKLEAKIVKRKNKTAELQKELDKQKCVDGFYFSNSNGGWMMYSANGKFKFGLNGAGCWLNVVDEENRLNNDFSIHLLANPKEVTERLTKFVNGLGYNLGVKIQYFLGRDTLYLNNYTLSFERSTSKTGEFIIRFGGAVIWTSYRGWAKIIQESKYRVESISESSVQILKGNSQISHSEWTELANKIEGFLNGESDN